MTFFGYILESSVSREYYIGQTKNLENRVARHNRGCEPSTKHGRPWKLVLSVEFGSRGEAVKWERSVKGRKRRSYIESLIRGGSASPLAHSVPPNGRDANPRPVPVERDGT